MTQNVSIKLHLSAGLKGILINACSSFAFLFGYEQFWPNQAQMVPPLNAPTSHGAMFVTSSLSTNTTLLVYKLQLVVALSHSAATCLLNAFELD